MECLKNIIENEFFIAIAAALFAVFFKHVYDSIQKDNHLNKQKVILIDIIENIIIKNLKHNLEDCKKLKKKYKQDESDNKISIHNITNSLSSELLNFIDKKDLIDIFLKIDEVKISDFYESIIDLNAVMKNNSIQLETNYLKAIDEKAIKFGLFTDEEISKSIHLNEYNDFIEHELKMFDGIIDIQINNLKNLILSFDNILNGLKNNHS